jgi:hypothetical protein
VQQKERISRGFAPRARTRLLYSWIFVSDVAFVNEITADADTPVDAGQYGTFTIDDKDIPRKSFF